jgi:AcrR family transcriptional regulator
MGTKERREREKAVTRDKILDAARELFAAEGYEGVTMRKVADKIEYSATAIYVHFADKQQLFRELCQQDFATLAQAFQTIAGLADPVERLAEIGRAYVEFGRQYPNHYKLMFMTPAPPEVLGQEEFAEYACEVKGNPEKDAYAFLKSSVQQAIDAGRFRDGLQDAEMISQTLWAAVHGVISLTIAKHHDEWVDWRPLQDRTDTMLNAVIAGLTKPSR